AETHLPEDGAAPIVADEHGFFDAERIEEAGDIGAEDLHGVLRGVSGGIGATVAAKVGGDGAEAGIGEGVELVAPGVPEFGPAVEHHDREALAGFGNVHFDAVGLHRMVADFGHGTPPAEKWAEL